MLKKLILHLYTKADIEVLSECTFGRVPSPTQKKKKKLKAHQFHLGKNIF